jgi:TM2 domain-containing membrane protein YozV
MNKIFICIVVFTSILLSQDKSELNELHSPQNIKVFADYLFCSKDYLRAAEEYERYLSFEQNDTAEFKIVLSYSRIGNYKLVDEKFHLISDSSVFNNLAEMEYYKSLFQREDYSSFREIYWSEEPGNVSIKKLFNFSFLFTQNKLPSKEDFISPYDSLELSIINDFYNSKINPPYKSPVTALLISTVIPGGGKIYTGEYGDGIAAFITTGLFAFLAYDNFKANHDFRGWLFAGLGTFFYAGNIYGSYASAEIHNARVDFEFNARLNLYLSDKNYFIPEIRFCD